MTMIQERYVSFEVAKMLKEKGFNEPCRLFYKNPQAGLYEFKNIPKSYKDIPNNPWFCAPSLYVTMEWLREKGIVIETRIDFDCMSEPPTYAFVGYSARIYTIEKAINVDETRIDRYETYEEAVEAAILYSLKELI